MWVEAAPRETLEHHYQRSREVKTLDDNYVQTDLCQADGATGLI